MAKLFANQYDIIDNPRTSQGVQVFTARDVVKENVVSITSYVGDDKEGKARFLQEIDILTQLEHENIIPIIHHDEDNGRPFYVTDFVHFASLRDWCGGTVDLVKQLETLADLATALAFAHQQEVIHRNLKPENVLLSREGELRLAGWGRSRSQEASKEFTKTGLIVGTPEYLAPEQIKDGSTSKATDLYSFGALAYAVLGGKAPFRGKLNDILRGHLFEEPPPLSKLRQEITPAIEDFVRELLAKEAEERPSSFSSVARRLRRLARSPNQALLKSSSANVIIKKPLVEKPSHINRGAIVFCIISLLVLSLVLASHFSGPRGMKSTNRAATPRPTKDPKVEKLRRARLQEEYKILLTDFLASPRIRASNPQLRKPDELLSPSWLQRSVLRAFAKKRHSLEKANEKELKELAAAWLGCLDLLLRLPPVEDETDEELGLLTLETMAFSLFELIWRAFQIAPLDKAWDIARLGDREFHDADLEGDCILKRLYTLNFPWVQDRRSPLQDFLAKESLRMWQREDEKLARGKRAKYPFSFSIIKELCSFISARVKKQPAALALEKLVYNSVKRPLDERLCAFFITTFCVHAEDYIDNEERMGRIRRLAKESRRLVKGWRGKEEPPYAVKTVLMCQRIWLRRMWVFSEHLFANHLPNEVLNKNRLEAAMLIHTVINRYSGKGVLEHFHKPALKRLQFHKVHDSKALEQFLTDVVKKLEAD